MRTRAACLVMAALVSLSLAGAPDVRAQLPFEEDTIPTSMGPLVIGFVGHGTLLFCLGDLVIHVDPVGAEADYTRMPDADLILVTHEHGDHLDPDAIAAIREEETQIVTSASCADRVQGVRVVANGERLTVLGILIEAIPAYNIEHKRPTGVPYHPRGVGNGYVLTFGDTRVYVAGDTERTPEMTALKDIDVAFLPMNLPYTMTPAMVADAARAFRPRILYPYHFGETDTSELQRLLETEEGIEVRVRAMS
jgi:L-ascorbate metabolism protein UlaG (beta-lactamase superfamily)